MRPTTKDFEFVINLKLEIAHANSVDSIEINAGELHRYIGGYPGQNHRMPSCCEAMHNAMAVNDVILTSPKKGHGSSLTIKYILPR